MQAVETYLRSLQDTVCHALEHEDGRGRFIADTWERPAGGGG
ncbi:MAG: coproporphyrinogen III oxidase, partial [Pseudomonadota bacterium]